MSTQTTDEPQPLGQHPMFELGTDGIADAGVEDDPHAESEPAGRRRRHRRASTRSTRGGGMGLCVVGTLLVLGGLALAVLLTSKPATLGNLAQFLTTGVTPGTIVMVGFALLAGGLVIRATQNNDTERLEDSLVRVEDSVERLANTTPAIEGDELHRVLMLLQRQDEKVNNLTRAIKMYGKPLVELGNASSDILGRLRDLQGELKSKDDPFQELDKTIAELSVRVSELQGNAGTAQLEQILSDQSELRQALASVRTSVEELAGRDPGAGLEGALSGLTEKIEQAASGPDYEDSFRSLQRELQGLATTLGNIQANMGRMGSASTAAPAATAPAPAPAPAPQSSSSSLADPPENKPGPGGLAQSIAGTKPAKGGKNVLGAIAKLKSMRN